METQTFSTVWYISRENVINEMKVLAFDDTGILTITNDFIDYKGGKYKVKIPKLSVKFISMGKQGRDFVNNWVKILYVEQDKVRTAFFADGSGAGWGGMFGGTKAMIRALEEFSYVIQENKDFEKLRAELQKIVWSQSPQVSQNRDGILVHGDEKPTQQTQTRFGSDASLSSTPEPTGRSDCIFVSYRRSDSADIAGRIYDRLVGRFGRNPVFKDVDSIPLGLDFKEYLDHKVAECNVLLAIIGDRWLDASDSTGNRRLDDPEDFVRIEIQSALNRNILVIPLLVRNANMPREQDLPISLRKLVYRNGIPIRADPDFHRDMDRLISALEKFIR
jgi:TIR domain